MSKTEFIAELLNELLAELKTIEGISYLICLQATDENVSEMNIETHGNLSELTKIIEGAMFKDERVKMAVNQVMLKRFSDE